MKSTFQRELESLINKYSYESPTNTPDFILAEYLMNCLSAYNVAIQERDKWHIQEPEAKLED